MFLELRLKARNFIKKHKNKLIVILVVWLIIVIINFVLAHKKENIVLNTTYAPHEVLLKSDFNVPKDKQNPIEDLIYDYVEKCNNKDYSGAFNLLTNDCKTHVFDDSLDKYKEYASAVFNNKKRYTIQNYSNYGQYYIYNIKLIDDIIKDGLTGKEYAYYEEKLAIQENENGLQLCVNNYMGHDDLKKSGEDDYLKVRIEDRLKFYEYEVYKINITNKTDQNAIIYNEESGNEVLAKIGDENRLPTKTDQLMILGPHETRTFNVTFQKFYDGQAPTEEIILNKIRIVKDYTGKETDDEILKKAEKTYSMSIPIQ